MISAMERKGIFALGRRTDKFERIDKKTNQVTGIAIHGFKKRTEGLKEIDVSLPIDIQLIS